MILFVWRECEKFAFDVRNTAHVLAKSGERKSTCAQERRGVTYARCAIPCVETVERKTVGNGRGEEMILSKPKMAWEKNEEWETLFFRKESIRKQERRKIGNDICCTKKRKQNDGDNLT